MNKDNKGRALKSASRMLLKKTFTEVWRRGEEYADKGRVEIVRHDHTEVEALVRGTEQYVVNLKFSGGGISKRCNCPYAGGSSAQHAACKHMVAVAILWDEMHGIQRPSRGEIESSTVPPPTVSRAQINALYDDPLNADLNLLRVVVDERGSWSRPHSRLPAMPDFNPDEKAPLTLQEIKKAFQEIAGWARRRTYDRYFCAGEMISAFCDVLRITKRRISVTPPLIGAEILREAQKFHYKLIQELIDDSDGLHVFNEAHLEDIYKELKKIKPSGEERNAFENKIQEFDEHREDY
jgi:uncharacterized Zn finger protein